jgi:hypothetical protein
MPDVIDLAKLGEHNGNVGDKEVSQALLDASVKRVPRQQSEYPSGVFESSLLWFVASSADDMEPWGRRVKVRDFQLRNFIGTESTFTSGLGTVVARNAAFDWKVEGPPRTSAAMHRILEDSDQGRGWTSLISKLSIDLYTQDNGAFAEIARLNNDSPDSPVIALNHLDSSRCWNTGDPLKPVIYLDIAGAYHLLNWWSVAPLSEMPAPVDIRPGIQFCALTRLMLAAQVVKNVAIYQREKTGGRNTRAIHMIQGITTDQVNDALDKMRATADAQGLLRYVNPLVVGTIDPEAKIDIKTLELASLPESWDEEKIFKIYVAQIAMAFLTDYQEFAPLPGGNLGTSAQSQVLHDKSRGKGPGLFMKILSHAMNRLVMPKSCEFRFDQQDLDAEEKEATIKKTRREGRSVAILSGELSILEARQEAVDLGDLDQALFERAGGLDMTENITLTDEDQENTGPDKQQPDVTQQDNLQPVPAQKELHARPFRLRRRI